MDEIIGAVILLVMAVVSIISKMQQKRQMEERRQDRTKRVRAEDLPEATRRMIYGTPKTAGGSSPALGDPGQGYG